MKLFLQKILAVVVCTLLLETGQPVHVWEYSNEGFQSITRPARLESVPKISAADINGDAIEECLFLQNGALWIGPAPCNEAPPQNANWQSPAGWQVRQAIFADLNRDGQNEAVLLVWRPHKPWPVDRYLPRGGRIESFQNAAGQSCHLVLIGAKNGQKLRELWAGSALANPLESFIAADLDNDGFQELAALEGDYAREKEVTALTAWEWNGFGFTLLTRVDGYFKRLEVRATPQGSTYLVTNP